MFCSERKKKKKKEYPVGKGKHSSGSTFIYMKMSTELSLCKIGTCAKKINIKSTNHLNTTLRWEHK